MKRKLIIHSVAQVVIGVGIAILCNAKDLWWTLLLILLITWASNISKLSTNAKREQEIDELKRMFK